MTEYERQRAEALDVREQVATCRFTATGELREAFRESTRSLDKTIAALDNLQALGLI